MTVESHIVGFYRGVGRDRFGRTLAQMLAWDDATLEAVHDYIQTLFPLPEASAFNSAAPILGAADIAAFAADATLRENLGRAFHRMLQFYGFTLDDEGGVVIVSEAANFADRAENWISPHNHNFLRITRILRCLHLLGLGAYARAFLAALEMLSKGRAGRIFGERTLTFWRGALTNQ